MSATDETRDPLLLTVEDAHKRRSGRAVLAGTSLAVARGELVAVVGENGSGKSTLLQAIAGVLPLDRGAITLDGVALARARARALSRLGWVPDRPDFPPSMRVDEWLALVASLRGARPADEAAREAHGVSSLGGRPLSALSLGQARRVLLLAATVGAPPLWVLDEPTNGLDAEALGALATRLRAHAEGGGGALLATHDRAFAASLGARIEPMERLAKAQGAVMRG